MYRAKESGRNTYRFFTPEMQERSVRTLQLENALRHAVKDNQLVLEYQPQRSWIPEKSLVQRRAALASSGFRVGTTD